RDAASVVFGIGLVLTAFGSAFYHWSPNDHTLLYDRAGMVVALMAVVALLVDSTRVLVIAELIGIGSLIWWQMNGDLRLYGVVQFFPGLLILLRIATSITDRRLPVAAAATDYRQPATTRALWLVLLFYAIAKVCEQFDAQIY